MLTTLLPQLLSASSLHGLSGYLPTFRVSYNSASLSLTRRWCAGWRSVTSDVVGYKDIISLRHFGNSLSVSTNSVQDHILVGPESCPSSLALSPVPTRTHAHDPPPAAAPSSCPSPWTYFGIDRPYLVDTSEAVEAGWTHIGYC